MADLTNVENPTPKKRRRNPNNVRITVEIPKANLEDFKVLCHVYGKAQKAMVSQALNKYIMDRRELVKQYLDLREKSAEQFEQETLAITTELMKECSSIGEEKVD